MSAAANPRFIGIGGALTALLAGLIGSFKELPRFYLFPLNLILALPLFLLFPGLYALFIYSAALKMQGTAVSCSAQLKKHLKLLVLSELCYLLFIFVLYSLCGSLMDSVLGTYLGAGSGPEGAALFDVNARVELAKLVMLIWQGAGGIYLLAVSLLCCVLAAHLKGLEPALSCAFKAFLKNLPAFLFMVFIAILAFTFIERYFAELKVERMRSVMLTGESGFDFALIFILLRLYVLYALTVALTLSAGGACGIFKLSFGREDD